jgi:hypothetical protein
MAKFMRTVSCIVDSRHRGSLSCNPRKECATRARELMLYAAILARPIGLWRRCECVSRWTMGQLSQIGSDWSLRIRKGCITKERRCPQPTRNS